MILVINHARLAASATMAQPVVAGRSGEVVIEIENRADEALHDVRLGLRETGISSDGAGRHLATIPPFDDGYCLTKLNGRVKRRFTFAVRPLHAESGIKVPMELHVEAYPEPTLEYAMRKVRDWRTPSAAKLEPEQRQLQLQGGFEIDIEARPEIYAAIGALELARRWVEKGYDGLKELGRETHQNLQTTLPGGTPIEPARVALSEDSFRGLFELVGAGVRVFEAARRNLGGDGSGGSGGGSSS
jgi:hypothetical protein